MNEIKAFQKLMLGIIRTMSNERVEPMFFGKDVMLQRRDEEIARLQPKADYTDRVLNSVSCFTTTQIAKELEMTGCELNFLLRMLGIQYRQSGQYMLYADYARQGLAKSRTLCIRFSNGRVKTHHYLVWTEVGREFIHRLLNPEFTNKNN